MASAGSVGIGRILGIPIELHWIFILMIVFFVVLDPYFGLIWILLFVCVLIHELSHSVTARRHGVAVSRIILLPFGGVSVIDTTRISPSAEFRISVSGPLMSLFLGGAFGIVALLLPPSFLEQLVNELFILNVFLGVLNIIPAFPMDGGRIFRSYVQRSRSFFDATMLTAKVSKAILGLMVAATLAFLLLGLSYPLDYRLYVLVWIVIIVLFLYAGLRAEVDSAIIKKRTAGMRVGEAVSRHFAYIRPDATIDQLYLKMKRTGEHMVVTRLASGYGAVVIGNRPRRAPALRVSDLSVPIPSLSATMQVADAIAKLSSGDAAVAAVVGRRNRLLGILTYQQLQAFISLRMMGKRAAKPQVPGDAG